MLDKDTYTWGEVTPTREDKARTAIANAAQILNEVAASPRTNQLDWSDGLESLEELANTLGHIFKSVAPCGIFDNAEKAGNWDNYWYNSCFVDPYGPRYDVSRRFWF